MNNILYRAKRSDNYEWVYGYYVKIKDYWTDEYIHVIFSADPIRYPDEYYEIIPETVGRLLKYTCYDGYHEVDRIFQNDIIAMWERHADIDTEKPHYIALALDEHSVSNDGFGRRFPQDTTRIRVIGNAYDNPELLKGHDLNHFVNGLNDYPGDTDEYIKRHRYLSEKYKIHGAQACCYMCNFENDYICHQFNGGCKRIDVCRKIREEGD